jgi:hypothetical protein
MATKSVYYGYTLRTPNSPYSQWALSQLPIPVSAMFTSDSTESVVENDVIPITGVSFNQVGGKINSDGTFSLPSGLYKIKFITLVNAAAVDPVSISLKVGTTTVLQSVAAGSTEGVTIQGETLINCSGCNVSWSLVNTTAGPITPESMGLYTAQVIIERLL